MIPARLGRRNSQSAAIYLRQRSRGCSVAFPVPDLSHPQQLTLARPWRPQKRAWRKQNPILRCDRELKRIRKSQWKIVWPSFRCSLSINEKAGDAKPDRAHFKTGPGLETPQIQSVLKCPLGITLGPSVCVLLGQFFFDFFESFANDSFKLI